MGRFVILSGPSCVGKGPLCAALRRFYPELAEPLRPLVLFNSRAPRPGEADGLDYHFRPRGEIEEMRGREGVLVMDVRGDLQALDLAALDRALKGGDVFFEGNPFVGSALLASSAAERVPMVTAFLSPLSKDELRYLRAPERRVSLPDFVADVMRRKLLRRVRSQKGSPSLPDLEEVERRARSAYAELKTAWRFRNVIPNHDGEDSENWNAFYYPLGDARRALVAFAELLQGSTAPCVETWTEGDPL